MSESLCFVFIAQYAFINKDKRICLKLLNKKIAARAEAVWLPFLYVPLLRRSQIVCPKPRSTTLFQFPDEITIRNEWLKTRALHTLVGFENEKQDGTGFYFNFILSNGTRSTQRDGDRKYYDHMVPDDAFQKIRSVDISHYYNRTRGFSFFDKDRALLWKIGNTHPKVNK